MDQEKKSQGIQILNKKIKMKLMLGHASSVITWEEHTIARNN